jgi:carbon monoxide dehydrogenase subunit G
VKVAQRFTVARPLAEVWAFFGDVPAVARCMPGAELLEDKGDGLYAGKVKVRLGPFGANFEGEARVTADPAGHSGHVEGKGVDKRGGSRTRMVMDYRLRPAGDGTEVTVDADVSLAGAIAQVGRTGLIQETASILVQDFARALEAQLAPAAATAPGATTASPNAVTPPAEPPAPAPAAKAGSREIRGGSLALRALWAWLRSLLHGLLGAGKKG